MARRARPRPHVALAHLLQHRFPGLDADAAIRDGRVLVDGSVVANPRSRVRPDASLRVLAAQRLRGSRKLALALDALDLDVAGAVALDVGAAAGGFTQALLERGATRVYAVDVGHGQLRGALRADERVVVLERTNLASLDRRMVPEPVDVVTIDVSYLSLAAALPQLSGVEVREAGHLVALVKPTFELHRGRLAADDAAVDEALAVAALAAASSGWEVVGQARSEVRGRRGAVEAVLHGRRAPRPGSRAGPRPPR